MQTFAKTSLALATLMVAGTNASHLDDTDGFLSGFKWDNAKFKTKTDCSLDKYTSVSIDTCATRWLFDRCDNSTVDSRVHRWGRA
jgi:hypothetical protein